MLSCHPWQLSGRREHIRAHSSPHNEHSVPLEESGYFNPVRFFRFLSGEFQITGCKNPHPEVLPGLPLPGVTRGPSVLWFSSCNSVNTVIYLQC